MAKPRMINGKVYVRASDALTLAREGVDAIFIDLSGMSIAVTIMGVARHPGGRYADVIIKPKIEGDGNLYHVDSTRVFVPVPEVDPAPNAYLEQLVTSDHKQDARILADSIIQMCALIKEHSEYITDFNTDMLREIHASVRLTLESMKAYRDEMNRRNQ